MKEFDTPILFLVFNRPDLTQIVFNRIREIKPKYLFVAADGPRTENDTDEIKCRQVREIISNSIDWTCELKTLYREENIGCRDAVSGAIDWFFEQVEMGIILEDDVLPDLSFFSFCEELLLLYKDDQRVMQITGVNVVGSWRKNLGHYFFSNFGGIWGWATWKRAWDRYDPNLSEWNTEVRRLIRTYFDSNTFVKKIELFDQLKLRKIDTWDYQWTFSKLINHGLSVVPCSNLIKNIGFRLDATHTKNSGSKWSDLECFSMQLPLRINSIIIPDIDYDKNFMSESNQALSESNKLVVNGSTIIRKLKIYIKNHLYAKFKRG